MKKFSLLTLILILQQSIGLALVPGPAPVSLPYTNYLASVTIMLVMLFIFAFVIKKIIPGTRYQGKSRQMVTILDRIQIEPTVCLYLIKMKDKVWLISVGNKNTQLISDVTGLVSAEDYVEKQPQFSFQEILDKVVKKKDEK